MSNNKQKSSIEWQFEELFNSFEKFNNGEYTFDEYLKRNLEIRDQAQAGHKDELLYSWIDGVVSADSKKRFEDYYNETYGGGEQ